MENIYGLLRSGVLIWFRHDGCWWAFDMVYEEREVEMEVN
jgi:hypothetical protein